MICEQSGDASSSPIWLLIERPASIAKAYWLVFSSAVHPPEADQWIGRVYGLQITESRRDNDVSGTRTEPFCYPCSGPAPCRGRAVVNQTLASPGFWPCGRPSPGLWPIMGRRVPLAVMPYEREALVIIVILIAMV